MSEASGRLNVWVLGGFRVAVGTRRIDTSVWRLRRTTTLIKVLALAPGYRMHREQVVDRLWPEGDLRSTDNSLHQVLHFARRALYPDRPRRAPAYPCLDSEVIVLGPADAVWVDADAFEQAAARARRHREPTAYVDALRLYGGDLLPEDPYEEWAAARREALRQLHVAVRMELAALYIDRGELGAAHSLFDQVIGAEATYEPAHAGLMRVYALAGRPSEALQQYRRLKAALQAEVGAEPDAATQRLYEDIRAQRLSPGSARGGAVEQRRQVPTLRKRRSRTRTPSAHAAVIGNLPAPLTSFVGRETEVAGVQRALGAARIVTLLGPAGTGKTRLALRVATDVCTQYPDGAWFVDLSTITDASSIPRAVAAALGISETAEPVPAIERHLRARQLLLVLDNCEHLLRACAELLVRLLSASPGVRVLATSREALRIYGEVRWAVSGLARPDGGRLPPLCSLVRFDAVRLFIERARLSRPGFELAASNARWVVELCRRLDGLPLAIELAAARLGTLSPREIVERLPRNLSLLVDESAGLSKRQRTMRTAVAWSYDALSQPERLLYRRCAVFAGGFDLEAVEAICEGDSRDHAGTIDLLGRLIETSMLTVEETREGRVRYRLLETLREFARERLVASGEAEAFESRHAAYYLSLAAPAGRPSGAVGRARWLDRVQADYENVRAALRWTIARRDVEAALVAGEALGALWVERGPASDGRSLLAEILALPGAESPSRLRAEVLVWSAKLAWSQGANAEAQRLVEDGLTLARRLGDPPTLARALQALGPIARVQGDHTRARSASEESLKLFRAIGDRMGESAALQNLGILDLNAGDIEQAQSRFEEKLVLDRREDNRYAMAFALIGLAFVASRRQRPHEARRLFEECLELRRQVGDWVGIARTLNELGDLAVAQGDVAEARARFEESLSIARQHDLEEGVARALGSLGTLAISQNRLDLAEARLSEYLTLVQQIGDRDHLVRALRGFAHVAAAGGSAERALRLGGAALALAGADQALPSAPTDEFDRVMTRARAALPADAAAAAWTDGLRMDAEAAAAYALGGAATSARPRVRRS
jgi:predicted ATPase/DNA-binding SARP family transcriptional activator